jgi:phosphoribosylamine---glycine ligase
MDFRVLFVTTLGWQIMSRVLLVGSGGREHAIARSLVKDSQVELFSARSFANPGLEALACAELNTEENKDAITSFARKHRIDFAVVGPEGPLKLGVSDALTIAGIPCVGPTEAAARIETSKVFMRQLLQRHEIAGRLGFLHATDLATAESYAASYEWRVAVKPVGLTGGKGVKVYGADFTDADGGRAALAAEFSTDEQLGTGVLVEELAIGEEFTLQFFCDGTTGIPTPLVQDHKRALDGDLGPNTGGMGAYSCADGLLPFVSTIARDEATRIGLSVIRALRDEGMPFVGTLYGQFMLTATGVRVIEFNARFGDPEAINTLALLRDSYVEVCRASISGRLSASRFEFERLATVSTYLTPVGYGTKSSQDDEILVDERSIEEFGCSLILANCVGKYVRGGRMSIRTRSSRSMAIVACAPSLTEAFASVRSALSTVSGKFHVRTDIGSPSSVRNRVENATRLGIAF